MRKKTLLNICASFSVFIFCYLFVVLGIIMYFNAPNNFHKDDKRFIIDNGMTFREVVEKLHKDEIIEHPTAFLYISQLINGIDPKVRYGEYFFQKEVSYYKIMQKMSKGNIWFRKITITEGLSTDSAIDIIKDAPGLIGEIPSHTAEGSLLPETYFYSYNDTKTGLIHRMQDAMNKAIDELWVNRDKTIPVRTKEKALILASIVEKEAGSIAEMPKVASVFTNRLRKNMKLQSDPTIIYSYAFGNKELERPIRRSDIRNKSKFNTYNIYGLPPTPICNPGLDSIKAVLHPSKTRYLYFVASGDGDHIFATNLKDHNSNVAKYRKYLRDRALEAARKKAEEEAAKKAAEEEAAEEEIEIVPEN